MRGSATMGDFPSLERNGGASVEERRAGSSGDLLSALGFAHLFSD